MICAASGPPALPAPEAHPGPGPQPLPGTGACGQMLTGTPISGPLTAVVEDGPAVGVGERGEQLGRGGGWLSVVRVVVALDLSLIGVEFGFGAIPPAEEVAEALLGRGGPGKQRSLVRVEQVAKCLEPALLDVLAAAGGEVGEHDEDVVVEVMQAGEGSDAVPGQVVEVGEFFQEPHHLCGPDDGRRVCYNRTDSPLWKIIQAASEVLEPDEDRPAESPGTWRWRNVTDSAP